MSLHASKVTTKILNRGGSKGRASVLYPGPWRKIVSSGKRKRDLYKNESLEKGRDGLELPKIISELPMTLSYLSKPEIDTGKSDALPVLGEFQE